MSTLFLRFYGSSPRQLWQTFMANGANLPIYEPNSPLIHVLVIDLDDIATRYNHSSRCSMLKAYGIFL